MNITVIAPHPDDEVLGCGGTIVKHVQAGDRVQVIIVTRGDPRRYTDEQVAEVRAELQQAKTILGYERVEFLDFPAPKLDLISRAELAESISRTLRDFQTEQVYVPYPFDVHADHGACTQAALIACRPGPGSTVRELLTYETPSETEWASPEHGFVPSIFIDISETLPQKLRAMACY